MERRFLPPAAGPDDAARAAALLAEGRRWLDSWRLEPAEAPLRAALALAPKDAGCLLAMATWHSRAGTNPAAWLDLSFRAVQADFQSAESHKVFGMACRAHGIADLAIGHLRKCTDMAPHDANAFFVLGLTLVQFGIWEDGWRTYEKRPTMQAANGYTKPAPPGTVEWVGQDLTGRTLVLLGEDGHGDQIMTFRFARNFLGAGLARLILDVRPALRRLFVHTLRGLPGGEIVSAGNFGEVDGVDYVLATGSGAARFGASSGNLAQSVPYLRPAFVAPLVGGRLRIGVAWRGSPWLGMDRVRSVPLDVFRDLFIAAPNVTFVCLQEANLADEERAVMAAHGVETPIAEGWDFLDTAGVVAGLDLIISVDTSIAHLAGGLGRPVWLLNRATSEWRWGWKQSTSPWYPTMRILNQEKLLEWGPVVREVREALAGLV